MIVYDRLWETIKDRNLTQYRLIKTYGVSAGQIGRLKKNMYVSTHTIELLCKILDCRVEDVMEYRLDISQNTQKDAPDPQNKDEILPE